MFQFLQLKSVQVIKSYISLKVFAEYFFELLENFS